MEQYYASISITKNLRKVLQNIGKKNETYEYIIWRMIKDGSYDEL